MASATSDRASFSQEPGAVRFGPLCAFFALSLAGSWTLWLWPVNEQASFRLTLGRLWISIPLPLVMEVAGNCVPRVLALLWSNREGREQVRLILSSLIRWRLPLKWYVFSLVLPAGLFWISLGFIFLRYPSGHALPSVFRVATTLLLTLPFGPLWEELAWRAYALRKMESRFTPFVSALFLGLYWGVWHIPLWLTTMTMAPGMKIPVLMLACINLIAWSVIFTFLFERSGQSLPATILLHGTYAAMATEMAKVTPQNDFALIVALSVLSCCVALILGARLRADERRLRNLG